MYGSLCHNFWIHGSGCPFGTLRARVFNGVETNRLGTELVMRCVGDPRQSSDATTELSYFLTSSVFDFLIEMVPALFSYG